MSLLLATVISGICLAATMMGFWVTSRRDGFKLTWSLGVLIVVGYVIAYSFYAQFPHPALGAIAIALLPIGLSIVHGAAHQYFEQRPPLRRVALASALSLAFSLPPLAIGYSGVAFIVHNFAAAILLAMAGNVYFRNRAEAPQALIVMAAFYQVTAISFALCGLVLLAEGQWVLVGAPDNWAERINIVVSIIGMTGAGALSIALDQTRLAQRHRAEAITDPLTGLLNRRGMMLAAPTETLGAYAAVAVFDLDYFKRVNDTHGHAIGDEVLCRFAGIVDEARRKRDLAVRLGGEEFALVMPRVTEDQAAATVRRICATLAAEQFTSRAGSFRCTASAGIGFGDDARPTLDEVVARADHALYAAKHGGRNRVELARLASAS